MSHKHSHSHNILAEDAGHLGASDYRRRERKALLVCFVLTFVTMIAEAVFGYISHSLALIGDAAHMLSHAGALAVSYIAIVIAAKPTTRERSFGLYRAEVLGAFLNGITLLFITAFIVIEAIKRFLNPGSIVVGQMLVVAIAGLVVNLITALILWRVGEKGDLNIYSAFLHMLGDLASSVGVIVCALIIWRTDWLWLDPLMAVAIAVIILVWTYQLLRNSVHILLESTPRHIKVDDVVQTLKNDAEVRTLYGKICSASEVNIHDIHIWEITFRMYAMTAHIRLSDCPVSAAKPLLERMRKILSEKYRITHAVFEIECAQ